MSVNWTQRQSDAINSRGGAVAVSAAAGSGKTAVLVERIIRRITDEKNPCGVDKLLVVTFTRAAAAQMRSRLDKAIDELLEKEPDNIFLLKQKMLLPCADISTIDGFCGNIVKENFHSLGISPDFKIFNGGEIKVIKREIINEVIDQRYGKENVERFRELSSLAGSARTLADEIIKLYDYTRAYAFPDEWLEKCVLSFKDGGDIKKSEWGKLILSRCSEVLHYCTGLLSRAADLCTEPELLDKYEPTLRSDAAMIDGIIGLFEDDSSKWNDIKTAVEGIKFPKLKPVSRGYESDEKEMLQSMRDEAKERIKKAAALFCASREEHKEDMAELLPLVSEAVSLVKSFGKRLDEKKHELSQYEFSDIEHFTLRLLIEKTADGEKKTELSRELSERYAEIYIDEFQDTNNAQNMIFTSVSNGNNIFAVGDVKQSIYRFRQAMPEIFVSLLKSRDTYNAGSEKYPAKIYLDRNFRSRKGVIGMVNFIFSSIMSEEYGGIDYSAGESLTAAAEYPERECADVELCVLQEPEGEYDKYVYPAEYIADYIKKAINSGVTVWENGVERPAKYKDFTVLLRKKKAFGDFVSTLRKKGIPAYADIGGELFKTKEIGYIISLLRIIDNPLQDIPLLSTMASPLYSFTADELSWARSSGGDKLSFCACVINASETNGKFKSFLDETDYFRRLSATLPADELIRRIYEKTDFVSIVRAMGDGEKRTANLKLLLSCAADFEKNSYKGLSAFLNYADKLKSEGGAPADYGNLVQSADVVKIMTIHASKGLEFPFCIIADCSDGFNLSGSEQVKINSNLGLGLKCKGGSVVKYDTLSSVGVKLAEKKADISEEMRILYVAMTRAKEKLILLSVHKNIRKELEKAALNVNASKSFSPFQAGEAGSYSDWILPCVMRHPDGRKLRELSGINIPFEKERHFKISVDIALDYKSDTASKAVKEVIGVDPDTVKEIDGRVGFEYKYSPLCNIPAKLAASEKNEGSVDTPFFACSKPAFLNDSGLTPAQKGTATHKFMQYMDFNCTDISSECDRLVEKGMLSPSEGEAVEIDKIKVFLKSDIFKRMLCAKELYREYKFAVLVKASQFEENLPDYLADEETLIQGIADCVYVKDGRITVVDYKTDRVKDEAELTERYKAQIEIYAAALSECFDMPLEKTVLYSFSLGKEIEIATFGYQNRGSDLRPSVRLTQVEPNMVLKG